MHASLGELNPDIAITKPLESHTDTILTLTYQPAPPELTIRNIISIVSNCKSPPFNVSIYEPPSLEEIGRRMQQRELRDLLWRLAFSVMVAVPTFVIGIVYMSLVPTENSTKQYLMQPMWAGNASRFEWSLFFLATPVMFYSAAIFHRRALKEIRGMWRKNSPIPLLQRFIRFGSMNLLVSIITHPILSITHSPLPGLIWGLRSLFLIHRSARPIGRSGANGRERRYNHLFRLCGFPHYVSPIR